MRKIISLLLTVTMLATLFVGFSVPVSANTAANYDAVITVTPDITVVDKNAENPVTITYTIEIEPVTDYIGVIQFDLAPSKDLTISSGKANTAELMYLEGVFDNGIFETFSYTAASKRLIASGTTSERNLNQKAKLLTVTTTVDPKTPATHQLNLTGVVVAKDGSNQYNNINVVVTDVTAEGVHTHSAVKTEAVDATCDTAGNIAYWYCEGCDKFFSDEALTTEITEAETIVAAGHDLQLVEAKAATCTEDGNNAYYICENTCGKLFEDAEATVETTIEAVKISAAHNLTLVEATPATCTTNGNNAYYTCSGTCGKAYKDADAAMETTVEAETILATNHAGYQTVDAVTPSQCGQQGNIAHVYCPDCQKYFADNTFATELDYLTEVLVTVPHLDLVQVAEVAKTCDTDGKAAHYYCSACQKFYSDAEGKIEVSEADLVIPASHEYGELIAEVAKTCETDGKLAHYQCADCQKLFVDGQNGKEEVQEAALVIPAGHEYGELIAEVAKTCTTDGKEAHYKCSVCNKFFQDVEGSKVEVLEADLVIPASHEEEIIPAVVATCTQTGLTEGKKCSVCNEIIVKPTVVAKLAHTLTETPAVAATCDTQGNVAYYTCSVCQLTFEDAEGKVEITDTVIPALGHSWGDWEVTTPAENGVTGVKTRVCANDAGHTETATIPALDGACAEDHTQSNGSTVTLEVTKEATCTETGTQQLYCSVCGEFVGEVETINALGHSLTPVAGGYTNCLTDGVIAHNHCSVCDKNFDDQGAELSTIVAPAKESHTFGDFVAGTTTCTVCGASKHLDDQNAQGATFDVEKLDTVLEAEDVELIEAGFTVEPKMEVVDVTVPSTELSDKITELGIGSLASAVFDITIDKLVSGGMNYVVPVSETSGLIEITVDLPAALQNHNIYRVIRTHLGLAEELSTSPNASGEYIVIDFTNNKIIFHVKKFSEYAIFGQTVSSSRPSSSLSGGGVSVSYYTVKFNTNGGSSVDSVKVKSGDTIEAPETVKDGYAFDGWYADYNFKTPFDFEASIKKNATVYAKWIEKTETNTIILTIGEKTAIVFGEEIENDVAPQIVSDRTMLPIRFVAESLGATVGWEEETETVTIVLGDIDIELVVGEMTATVNGEKVALDVKSFIENERTYLPIRFVAENLGAIVEWEEATQKVTIIER